MSKRKHSESVMARDGKERASGGAARSIALKENRQKLLVNWDRRATKNVQVPIYHVDSVHPEILKDFRETRLTVRGTIV